MAKMTSMMTSVIQHATDHNDNDDKYDDDDDHANGKCKSH